MDLWRFAEERDRIAGATRGMPLYFPRPGFSVLVALGLVATGGAPWSAVWVNAISGTATVALLALAGPWALGSRALAWTSALVLAASGYHVAYSRIGFAEAPATLLVLGFFLLYAAERRGAWKSRRATWIAGLVWGLACLVQDRLISSSFLVLVLEWVPGLAPRGLAPSRRLARTAALLAPLLALAAACEAPYYAAMLALKHFGEALPFPTHVERLARHYGQGLAISGWRPENWPTYPYLYAKLCGLPLCTLFLVGGATCLARRDTPSRLALAWAVVPLVPFSVTAAGARYACFTIPAFAIVAGAGALAIAGRLPARLAPAAVLALCLPGLAWAVPVTRLESGFPQAARALVGVGFGSVSHFSTQPYVSRVYLGEESAIEVPGTMGEVGRGFAAGTGFLLADAFEYLLAENDSATGAVLRAMVRSSTVTRWYPHPWGGSILFPFEYNFSFPRTMDFVRDHERDSTAIRLHLLSEAFSAGEEGTAREGGE